MKFAETDAAYYVDWQNISDADVPRWLEKFAAAGAKKIVLGTNLLYRSLTSREFLGALTRGLERNGLTLEGAHAPFARAGLNLPGSPEKTRMLRERRDMIALCGDLGVKVLVNHLSCREEFCDVEASLDELHRRSVRSLEELLPAAEKAGIVLALENIFFPYDNPDELLALTAHFGSPFLGVCYDFGHANVIADRPGASTAGWPEKLHRVWNGRPVVWERDILKRLLPEVVCLHMHDNDGSWDQHLLPGRGNVDWKRLLPLAERSPRLLSAETEVTVVARGVDPAELCATFRKLGFRS